MSADSSCQPRRRVCVFCGSSRGRHEDYGAAAAELGVALARQDIGVVFGGGKIGLMGVVADAALAARGHVVGVIPTFLSAREIAHAGLPDLRVVRSMHERKALMASLADAFIVLPGGMGTFEEMCEVLTWAQLGLHAKPVGLLNVRGYFDPFIALLDRAVDDGFMRDGHRALLTVEADVQTLLDALARRWPSSTTPVDEARV
ncbi:MAG: TIGR00730 family Rossman fold protein [Vicinamibacterales bacterium]